MKTIYILLITVLSWSLQACTAQYGKPDACTDSIPRIYPDYAGVTFPLNIAPPNFRIGENADAFQTEIGTGETADILYTSKSPEVIIPTKKWKKLLQKDRGKRNIHPHHPAEGREMDTLCGYQGYHIERTDR